MTARNYHKAQIEVYFATVFFNWSMPSLSINVSVFGKVPSNDSSTNKNRWTMPTSAGKVAGLQVNVGPLWRDATSRSTTFVDEVFGHRRNFFHPRLRPFLLRSRSQLELRSRVFNKTEELGTEQHVLVLVLVLAASRRNRWKNCHQTSSKSICKPLSLSSIWTSISFWTRWKKLLNFSSLTWMYKKEMS